MGANEATLLQRVQSDQEALLLRSSGLPGTLLSATVVGCRDSHTLYNSLVIHSFSESSVTFLNQQHLDTVYIKV